MTGLRRRVASSAALAVDLGLAGALGVLWLLADWNASFDVAFAAVIAGLVALAIHRARSERRMFADRVHFERQIDALPLATIAFDGDAQIVTWNRAAARLFGWSPSEVVGRRNPTVARAFRRESDALHRRIMEGETLRGVEVTRTSREGVQLELALYSAPIDPDAGPSAGFLVLYDDIAERQRTQRERDEAQSRYRSLVEALPLVTYIDEVDDYATNVYTSPQVEQLLGWPLQEWQDDPRFFIELLHPEDRERVMSHVVQTNATHTLFEDEYRLLHKDGHYVWVRDHSAIVEDEDGKLFARGFLLDITQQKRLEEQLLQAQKMDALGQFAGGIAHDFNNLLTGINGYADLAAGSLDDEAPALRCLDGIRSAATEAASLTSRLLAFSRRHVPERRLLDVNDIVEHAADLLRRVVREDVAVRLALESSLPPVSGDLTQLKQVVVNLALNARDAMDGRGTLTLETATRNGAVLLRVRDDGCGMDDATKARALEPFFTTKAEGEGTGLGLSVVYGVVDSLGGTIAIESRPGEGTTVEIVLPAAEGPVEQPVVQDARPGEGHAERILVVEDRQVVRDLAHDVLVDAGFEVETAAGGDEALAISAASAPFDLLLSDVVMPGMSGPELAERLRAAQPGLPVVFMSGYTDDVLADEVLALPRTCFLRKPFGGRDLVAAARNALDDITCRHGEHVSSEMASSLTNPL
jgi:PAS domain S-box-containing protein